MECGSRYCVPESLHPYTQFVADGNATGYDGELHTQFFQLAVDIKVCRISSIVVLRARITIDATGGIPAAQGFLSASLRDQCHPSRDDASQHVIQTTELLCGFHSHHITDILYHRPRKRPVADWNRCGVSVSDILWHTLQYFTSCFSVTMALPNASTTAVSWRSR